MHTLASSGPCLLLSENWPTFPMLPWPHMQRVGCFDYAANPSSLLAFRSCFVGREVLGLCAGHVVQGTAWSSCCGRLELKPGVTGERKKAPEKMGSEFLSIGGPGGKGDGSQKGPGPVSLCSHLCLWARCCSETDRQHQTKILLPPFSLARTSNSSVQH